MVPPALPDARDQAIRQRTAKLLGNSDPALAGMLETKGSTSALSLIEVRAIVVRLRAMMMDATFDDTHIAADISETSEMYEWWRQRLAQVS
jgi:hypothetical protein